MKKFILKPLVFIVSAILLSSCATMTRWTDTTEKNKKMYTVHINSKTRGLQVCWTENGEERILGYTPCDVLSDKAKIKYITVKNGEEYQTVELKTKARTSTYWNFAPFHTFIWGYFVDICSRRGLIYGQKDYYVDF
jgi:hypothetical protein